MKCTEIVFEDTSRPDNILNIRSGFIIVVSVSDKEFFVAFCDEMGRYTKETIFLRMKDDGLIRLYVTEEQSGIKGYYNGDEIVMP